MLEKPYFVYEAFDVNDTTGHRRVIEVTHYPLLDLKILSTAGYTHLAVVTKPMPLARAVRKAEKLKVQRKAELSRNHTRAPGKNLVPTFLGSILLPIIRSLNTARPDIVTVHDCRNIVLPTEEDLKTVVEVLQGRVLFRHEIRQALIERGHHITGDLHDILQTLILRSVIGRVPSVAIERFGIPSCRRCSNPNVIQASCAACSSDTCFYCPECASMGESRACRPLYYSPGTRNSLSKDKRSFAVSLRFELTPAQEDASQLVVDFIQDPEQRECLVFAVCGAGKTEVVFEAIAHVLRSGGKVLFAIPRRDVVAELVPRIRTAIPDARILELRGGAKWRYRDADIIVATTHQTLRFFRAFDLVILDEVDAFPYRGSRILHYAVRRATAQHGKTVFMTATPDRELLQKADRGEMALVRISARYHGRPLPEPEIVRVTLPLPEDYTRFQGKAEHSSGRTGKTIRSRFRRPDRVLTIIRRSLKAGRKLFVFVPTVALSDLVCKGLSNSLQIPRIASIHSSHPNRDLHREAFSKGEIDIIVSTSVLERGITVPNADVLILYADYEQVFDTATLIQMAGRAGRTEDDTEARVYFAAEHITPSMRTAVQLTHDMNRHAAASGYLQS